MEKIKKFLLKIGRYQRNKIESIIIKIASSHLDGMDIKKLRGYEDIFRIRTGNIRIIFKRYKKQNRILEISRRNSSMYKNI